MLLSKISSHGTLTRTLGANDDEVDLVFFFDWIWILDLKSSLLLLSKLSFDFTLDSG
jgi:hypothetical protein